MIALLINLEAVCYKDALTAASMLQTVLIVASSIRWIINDFMGMPVGLAFQRRTDRH